MTVVKEWWQAIEWVFDHPVGEFFLLVLAGWLVWSAVKKTTDKQIEKARLIKDETERMIEHKFKPFSQRFSAIGDIYHATQKLDVLRRGRKQYTRSH